MVYDALIIGNGIAGSCLALFLARREKKVCLITKGKTLEETNTAKAQGGIVFRGKSDSTELLVEDIMRASGETSFRKSARLLARLGPLLVDRFFIRELGIPFERDQKGEWDLFKEGAHSLRRILHVKDRTGLIIQKYLNEAVQREENITLCPNTFALELITSFRHSLDFQARYRHPECFGAHVLDIEKNTVFPIFARATVLATGGLNALFRHSSGGPWCTGDGFALALRAGATLINLEYVQFHPTLLYSPGETHAFLISETVRGEGGKLIDETGSPFLDRFHPLRDLAPRDVVARAIFQKMRESRTPYVYLDLRPVGEEKLSTLFPEIYGELLRRGFNPKKDPIPVVPGAHFACGGVLTDTFGRTSVRRLYAVGEVACTGVHGANRLASTSLLEGLTFAFRAAQSITEKELSLASPPVTPFFESPGDTPPSETLKTLREVIQNTMWEHAGLERTRTGLYKALEILLEVQKTVSSLRRTKGLSFPLLELENMALVALTITESALKNTLSFGSHFRSDAP